MSKTCEHFFVVKKTNLYGFFSTTTTRTIVKGFKDRKKAREYCDGMNEFSESSYAVWNGKGDIKKSDILYGVDTGAG